MQLTKELLLQKIEDCTKARDQAFAIAHLNAGAIDAYRQLLAQMELPVSAPDKKKA